MNPIESYGVADFAEYVCNYPNALEYDGGDLQYLACKHVREIVQRKEREKQNLIYLKSLDDPRDLIMSVLLSGFMDEFYASYHKKNSGKIKGDFVLELCDYVRDQYHTQIADVIGYEDSMYLGARNRDVYFTKMKIIRYVAQEIISDSFYSRVECIREKDNLSSRVLGAFYLLNSFYLKRSALHIDLTYNAILESNSFLKVFVPNEDADVRVIDGSGLLGAKKKAKINRKSENDVPLYLMTSVGSYGTVNIGERVKKKKIEVVDPEKFIAEYQKDTGKKVDVEDALVFFGKEKKSILDHLGRKFGIKIEPQIEGVRFTKEIYENTKFKCFILLREDYSQEYGELINDGYLKALNRASGEYLNIPYVAEVNTLEAINSGELEGVEADDLPCLYLWEGGKKCDGVTISIESLDNHNIVDIISRISQNAKNGYDINAIKLDAEELIESIRMKGEKGMKTIVNTGTYVGDGAKIEVAGNSIIGTGNTQTNSVDIEFDYNALDREIDTLKDKLDKIEKLEKEQVDAIKESLDEIKEACAKKDKTAIENAFGFIKKSLKYMVAEHKEALVNAFMSLPIVAKIFGA